ncbi:ABC transporter permease [Eubacteriales bacterium OttesenSCG-928-M02]|nr:ABC transporter permease [Eubacteriales bacterium OttesenSCG-928-M02]
MTFDVLLPLLWEETGSTLYMTFASTALSYVLGLPLGILLAVTDKNGLLPNRPINWFFNTAVNILRSAPFLILMIAALPLTRKILGTTLGSTATVIPLVIAAFPYVGRLVESSLKEVDAGMIEAMRSMGARPHQIILKGLLPEALPSLLTGATLATTTILGYGAMAGFIGGGGLGAVAINYGYYRYKYDIMFIALALLIIIVQLIQMAGNAIAHRVDKRQ